VNAPTPGHEAERLARAALARAAEPGDERVGAEVHEHGAVAVLEGLRSGALRPTGQTDYSARVRRADPARDLEAGARAGARFVCPLDDEWPCALDDLGAGAPWGLWVRGAGALADAVDRAVAVVGARAATAYGTEVASDLAAGLGDAGWTVVSGAAFGIDAAAHGGALAAAGPTVAVLPCGPDRAYPRAHEPLLSRVAGAGLLVGELPPGVPPNRPRFLVRNRLIAALSRGTVVVEAALRSGSLSTARHAARLHRQVMGVPGPVTSEMSGGVHELVRDDEARLVTGAADVLELVAPVGEHLVPRRHGETRPRDDLDPVAARVLEALPVRRPAAVARVAREAAVTGESALRALGLLDALGLAEHADGGWRLAAAERARIRGEPRREGS
jgi:DNA processing protein